MQTLQVFCGLLCLSLVLSGTQICNDPDNNAYSIITCGAPGKDGLPGKDGKNGLNGENGEQGQPGQSGPQGIAGPPGAKGEKGPSGQKGEKGDCDTSALQALTAQLTSLDGKTNALQSKLTQQQTALQALTAQLTSLDGRVNTLQSKLTQQQTAFTFFKGRATSGEKIYVSNGDKANYNDGKMACAKKGGQLASPRNVNENQAVLAISLEYSFPPFLGINSMQTKGTFRYLSGEIITYSNWSPGEPNNDKGVESCVEMYTNGKWNDKNCKEKRLTICEF
ncbi:pulmonary surfactant-associated protein D-like [Pseudophryne corroboree]|uniref:pulmonary surfactant-associated protein D-like n=1 Tax=Pseudophryne corroboree TaxID=495146 RepID=UPI00308135C8